VQSACSWAQRLHISQSVSLTELLQSNVRLLFSRIPKIHWSGRTARPVKDQKGDVQQFVIFLAYTINSLGIWQLSNRVGGGGAPPQRIQSAACLDTNVSKKQKVSIYSPDHGDSMFLLNYESTTRRHNPEEHRHVHRRENLKTNFPSIKITGVFVFWRASATKKQNNFCRWLSSGLLLAASILREAASTSKRPVNFCQTTRRNNPEDSHLECYSCRPYCLW
jgi:hypothetical protein